MKRPRMFLRWLITAIAVVVLAGCAGPASIVEHSFSFDTLKDGQDAEVIDYRYGSSRLPVRAPEWAVKEGKTFTFNSVSGPMLRGEFLYVKWRLKSTGQVYEDNVDLHQRLPADIKDHRIHFIINGSQLYIYLISPERRAKDTPAIGPSMYSYRKTTVIYPDQSKP